MTRPPTLRGFVARILLLLPPCFAAWFVASPWHAALLGPVALQFVEPWRTGLVSALARSGYTLSFETELEVGSSAGRVALLVAEVNPLIYTYGLALFIALMLATRTRVWKILLGVGVMLVFQAWSVAFDVLVQIAVLSGPEVAARAGLLGWRGEAIAIGYQFGALMFPSLVPVLLWASFNRGFIAGLRGSTTASASNTVRQRTDREPAAT